MYAHDIKKIACIGAGTIGASWATYYLWKGFHVSIQDVNEEAINSAKVRIQSNLEFLLEKGILTQTGFNEAMQVVTFTTSIGEAIQGVQFIQESAFENYGVKQAILKVVDGYAPEAIFASSTSGLLMTEIQKFSRYPERCITTHPYNPPHLIPLVELVKGKDTSEVTMNATYNFYKSIGKVPVRVNKEVPGHIANRITMAYWRECIDLVMNGVCSVEDVDLASCFGPGLRYALMGPHLIYHLGGGEKGVRGIIDHIGPSIEMWWEDMADWKKFPYGCKDILEEGIKQELGSRTSEELAKWRDEKIVAILKTLDRL